LLLPKLKLEQKFPRDLPALWNGAMPGSIAYLINCGGDPQKASVLCEPNLYRKVFLPNPLSTFTSDYARTEDARTAHKLNRLLREAYEQVGYKVIPVSRMSSIPQLSIARRLAFILSHVYEEEVE
jgi:predicted ATPase